MSDQDYAVEVGLFGALCDKENWDRYASLIDPTVFQQQSAIIWETLEMLHDKEMEVTASRLFECAVSHPKAKKIREPLRISCENVVKAEDTDIDEAIRRFRKEEKLLKLTEVLEDYAEGETPLDERIQEILDQYDQQDLADPFEKYRRDWRISTAFDEVEQAGGELPWPWDEMNRDCGKLGPGEFMILSGYVNSGKSSFMSSLVVEWLTNHLTDDQGIIVLNNEDTFYKALGRMYSVLLDRPLPVIADNKEQADQFFEKKLRNPERLWFVDEHHLTTGMIRSAIKDFQARGIQPAAVVVQDVDHCHLSSDTKYKQGSYGPLYATMRGIAKEFNTRMIGVSQMKATEEFTPYPSLSAALAWSKGDKQASVDMLITIGKKDDGPIRYIGCPKSKSSPNLKQCESPNDGLHMPLTLDKWTGRFKELPDAQRMQAAQEAADQQNKKQNYDEAGY